MNFHVERPLPSSLGIRVFGHEREHDGEVIWNLRRSPSDKLKNVMTIGIYDGSLSSSRIIQSLQEHMRAFIAELASHKPVAFSDTLNVVLKHRCQIVREHSTPGVTFHYHLFGGLNK